MSTHEANTGAGRPPGKAILIAGGVALFGAGAILTALLMGRVADPTGEVDTMPGMEAPPPVTRPSPSAPAAGPLPDITVPLSAESADRAGIELATAQRRVVATRLRLPGTVQPNEYQQVVVTPLVSGRVTAVSVQLGDRVARGAPLARIYSSDLAEAQSKHASLRAELQAAEQRLARTTRLVEIGAASRQELEADEAQRGRLAAELQGAAARLQELGVSPQRTAAAAASVTVPAPIAGVVIDRKANIGLVVNPSTELFTVASLSPVWVIADVQEADVSKVHVGDAATIEADAFKDRTLTGKVSYIAPDLRPETRTAQVRVEVPNPDGDLRFGMFVNVELITPRPSAVVTVPVDAVQTIGARHFVYVAPAGETGEYIEREVSLGAREDGTVEILRGVAEGERVVARGSFHVRAERERLGLRPELGRAAGAGPPTTPSTTQGGAVVKVTVGDAGFDPARIPVRPGHPVTLEFRRVSEKTCATEIVVPSQGIREALPLNKPVRVEIRPPARGEVGFSCGMDMLKGAVVVQ